MGVLTGKFKGKKLGRDAAKRGRDEGRVDGCSSNWVVGW